MPRDPRAFLWDAREAADAIETFIGGGSFDAFATSPLIHSAVERKFEIIGEALNQLSKSAPDIAKQIPELERIVAFRNLLIHGYAIVDHRRVWEIVQTDLPKLRAAVAALLDKSK
jgi:uncharacterized protein with HEPN domain